MTEALTGLIVQPRLPLQSQVYVALRKAIVNGKLSPGSKLVEGQLAAHLGVSRNPVREALRKLEQEGLVIHTPNHGVSVAQMTKEQSEEITVVREELEALSCRLAVSRMTPADILDLRQIVARSAAGVASGDVDELIANERGFHDRLAQIGGNATLERILSGLRESILRFRRAAIVVPDRPDEVVREHELILQALEAGDAVEAERLVTVTSPRGQPAPAGRDQWQDQDFSGDSLAVLVYRRHQCALPMNASDAGSASRSALSAPLP